MNFGYICFFQTKSSYSFLYLHHQSYQIILSHPHLSETTQPYLPPLTKFISHQNPAAPPLLAQAQFRSTKANFSG
jgi:hypothetical protein